MEYSKICHEIEKFEKRITLKYGRTFIFGYYYYIWHVFYSIMFSHCWPCSTENICSHNDLLRKDAGTHTISGSKITKNIISQR